MSEFRERVVSALADRYEIHDELGAGGMAIVYLARDLKHERNVAVKVLRPEIALALGTDRFLHEIKTTAQLSHPHILPLLDSGEAGGLLYYVMPLVEGESLRERLERERQFSYDDALQTTLEVGDALSYAHSRDVLHRDIKPENILLESGHAVIADFGIARAISTAGRERLTQAGMVVGTPAYMSPEQAGGDTNLDARSDVYSLAAVFYEMLVGEPPYAGPTPQAILVKQLSDEVPHISAERESVSPAVDHAVTKALAKLPADRYQTAQQFTEALQQSELTTDALKALKKRTRRIPARFKWLAAAVIVASVGGAAVLHSSMGVAFDERDWILITDFDNQTGDSLFDESLSSALTVGLQQSVHVNVFPEMRVAATLRRMGREDVETIGQEIGVEIALRENLRVLVVPRINRIDSVFDISMRIIDPTTGEVLKTRSMRATGRAAVLPTLDKMARRLRRDLGESMLSVARRSVELVAATTPSLEALRSWSEGRLHMGQRRYDEAASRFRRALELDSNFALAQKDMGAVYYYSGDRVRGDPHFERALSLADRVTERERLWIVAEVHNSREEREAAIEAYNVYLARYPDDLGGWFRLGYALMLSQQSQDAATAFERVIALDSMDASAHINLATVRVAQGRFSDALSSYHSGFEIIPGWRVSGNLNHEFGFCYVQAGELDSAEAVFQLMLSESEGQQAQGHRSLGLLHLYTGDYVEGVEHLRRSVILYRTLGEEWALSELRSRLFLALAHRATGAESEFQTHLARVRELSRRPTVEPVWLAYTGKAHIRSGLLEEARQILRDAQGRVNEDNRNDRAAVSLLEGELALAAGENIEAVELLEMAHALRSDNYYLESLARAHFLTGDYDAAETRYLELAGNKDLGWEAQEPWILSHYYLGRISEEKGDREGAAEYYSRFIDIWERGDDNLVALADARQRLQGLVGER